MPTKTDNQTRESALGFNAEAGRASLGLQESLTKHAFKVLIKHVFTVWSRMTCAEEEEGDYKLLPGWQTQPITCANRTEAGCSYKSCMTRASSSTSAIQESFPWPWHCSQSTSALVSYETQTMQQQSTE